MILFTAIAFCAITWSLAYIGNYYMTSDRMSYAYCMAQGTSTHYRRSFFEEFNRFYEIFDTPFFYSTSVDEDVVVASWQGPGNWCYLKKPGEYAFSGYTPEQRQKVETRYNHNSKLNTTL